MVIVYKLVAASLLAIANPSGSGDASKLKPIAMMQGGKSGIAFPLVRMIQDSKQWNELWVLHKGVAGVSAPAGNIVNGDAQTPPTVDFDKNQVLIVFGGQMSNVQAYDYVKTVVQDKDAVIQLAPNILAPSTVQVVWTPYIMLVLPKLKVNIGVELDTLAPDGTHYWAKLARFPAPK